MCIVSVYVGTWGEKNGELGFYILRDRYVAIQFDQYLFTMGFCFGVVFYGQLFFSRPAAIRYFCGRKIKCFANFKTMRETITEERVKTNLVNLFQFAMKKHSGFQKN